MQINFSNFLKEKINRDVKSLFLEMIYLLEDFLNDGKISENEFQRARKRVLDRGNNTIRSLDSQIEEFEITLKKTNKKEEEK